MAKKNINKKDIDNLVREGRKAINYNKRLPKKQRIINIFIAIIIIVGAIAYLGLNNPTKEVKNVPLVSLDQRYVPTSRDKSMTKETLNIKNLYVVDGDTFKDRKQNKTYRLFMIDTPETCILKGNIDQERNDDGTCKSSELEENNGKEAAYYLEKIFNDANTLTIEYNKNERDRYDRYLVWLFLDDKYLVQSMMADQGFVEGYYDHNGRFTQTIKKIDFYEPYKKLVANLRR